MYQLSQLLSCLLQALVTFFPYHNSVRLKTPRCDTLLDLSSLEDHLFVIQVLLPSIDRHVVYVIVIR